MTTSFTSPLDQSLKQIWPSLQQLDPDVQIIGGYGLLLKQNWLLHQEKTIPHFIPMVSWTGESIPRTTKDMDMGISPSLIANKEQQQKIHELLTQHGYKPDEKKMKWGWSEGNGIVLEFHSFPSSDDQNNQLHTDRYRIKNKTSLGFGIHGRVNPELIGFHHHLSFEYDGLRLTIPNVLTAIMMKLVAFKERLHSYKESPVVTNRNLIQAEKHARDAFRIVAMETEADMQMLPAVLQEVNQSPLYRGCQGIILDCFSAPGQEGFDAVSTLWLEKDRNAIVLELKKWFNL
ncbi:MAG: hypothetical protein RRY13_04090 [Akkermansia sp.]